MGLNTTTFPLSAEYSRKFNYNGYECGFGFIFNYSQTKLLLVYKNEAGKWNPLSNPNNPRDNGIFLSFMHSGPLGGAGEGYDPDGVNDNLPAETTTYLAAVNKYGVHTVIDEKLDDANDLLVANWGTYVGGEEVDVPDVTTFQSPEQANEALKAKFAGIAFQGGKLVRV